MMGCQPQGSSRHLSQTNAHYSLASHSHLEQTVSSGQHLHYPGQSSPAARSPATQHPGSRALTQHRQYRTDLVAPQAYYAPVSAESAASQVRYQCYPHCDTPAQQQQRFIKPAGPVTLCHPHRSASGPPQQFAWPAESTAPQYRVSELATQQQQFAHPAQTTPSTGQQFGEPVKTVVSQYQPPAEPHHHFRPVESASQQQQQQQAFRRPAETITSQHHFGGSTDSTKQQPLLGQSSEVPTLQSSPSFGQPAADTAPSGPTDSSSALFGQQSETLSTPPQTQNPQQPYRQAASTSPSHQQYFQLSPSGSSSTMLDKKPTLQVVTSDHSPVSPGSSTSSPRFIFPDMHPSSSSGHLGSDSGSSPFMSPVKREVKWEVGTPPQSSELDPAVQQVQRDRVRVLSGDTEPSETVADSETGSSVLEDSSSSREQSPFSAMAESLSLRSPSEHSPSPLARKIFQRQAVVAASEDEEQGEESEGGGGTHSSASGHPDSDLHPSKFKKRLHERYVLSLKDMPGIPRKFKEESADTFDCSEVESHSDSKRPVSKIERPDSPQNPESPMPKSPRRSSSDTDIVRTESTEMGASSADEGDVFMEPTMGVRTKHKPPSLHQKEPLDLSRGTFYSGYRSSSGSSPLVDAEHISPASKIFSPVFRSPHRLPYSPHGLLSPQSQSPLCSVPEGGRIFNFNMPSPLEGAHSDSDLISPSPMSPRIFTFPPQGSILNPMSEANRLAVSPRAPYTPPPSMMHSKALGSAGGGLDAKWGEQHGFYGKRSLSESDMTYLCPVCGQVFPTNDNLAKHMAKHLPTETVRVGDSNKVHYCKVCNRSFSRSDMLTRHMRLHTGLKPYECMECGQVFSRSDHLNTHRRTHTGEKPYRCPHCPYAACRRDMITRHMRTHAKRTSRRARYLSVPDDGDTHKASGSISSTETTDSQDYTSGHTCSVSSVDSVESESIHSSRPSYIGTSVDSLLSPDMLSGGAHSSSSSRKASEELEEGMEGGEGGQEGGSQFDRFMRYRKARNWSTTSLESVESEEALLREILVDDAFLDPDHRPLGVGEGGGGGRKDTAQGSQVAPSSSNPKDVVGLETKTLQKCFISPQLPSGGSSSSSS